MHNGALRRCGAFSASQVHRRVHSIGKIFSEARTEDADLSRGAFSAILRASEPKTMHLNIVNPNTTAAMTAMIAAAAKKAARPDTVIRAVSSAFGPASIEGAYDDAFAVPGLLERIREGEAAGVDAHVIACFDDTGLDAARALASAPVVGIGEAGFHAATLLSHRFA